MNKFSFYVFNSNTVKYVKTENWFSLELEIKKFFKNIQKVNNKVMQCTSENKWGINFK